MNIEKLAKEMYVACPSVKPDWEQLGGVTRSVWLERAQAEVETSGISAPKAEEDGRQNGKQSAPAQMTQESLF